MNTILSNSSFAHPGPQGNSYEALVGHYLPGEFRHFIEDNFYKKVCEYGELENFQNDPGFYKNPSKHIALYTDHGVVHVRDVAVQTLEVLERANGILVPFRDKDELEFLKGYALLLAYLHDIGMCDFTALGRFMHPEFAAQFVFDAEFDEMFGLLWAKNAGNVPWMINSLFKDRYDENRIKIIFREILALSAGHSKSKMPVAILNDPKRLKKRMTTILSKPLGLLFFDQKIERLGAGKSKKKEETVQKKIEALNKTRAQFLAGNENLVHENFTKNYADFEKEAFEWLELTDTEIQRFILNVQDSIRCIRAADALRQRGTVLRTSAGYEIFIDRKTAHAIYALRNKSNDRLYLLESKKSINAGEANIARSELDASGNLRVSFHVGSFSKQKVTNKAASNAALVIDDIQADTIQSFKRDPKLDQGIFTAPKVSFEDLKILVEHTSDNPNFATLVCQAFHKMNPAESHRIHPAFAMHHLDPLEVNRYLAGEPLMSYLAQEAFRKMFFEKLLQAGCAFVPGRPVPGEEEVRIIHLAAGDQLIQGGSKSGFVYFPLADGLRVYPLGGYGSTLALAWIPLGNTGVIRGSIRNAHVFCEKPVSLICVPKNVYLDHWYNPIPTKNIQAVWGENSF